MDRRLFEARFYETYYFASVVENLLLHQFDHLRDLEGFYCDDQYLAYSEPFPKYSALHSFIAFVVDGVFYDETTGLDLERRQKIADNYASIPEALEDLRPHILPIEEALQHYEIEEESFEEWLVDQGKNFSSATADDVYDYFVELRLGQPYESLLRRVTCEVFFVLFQNRNLLLVFNEMMASHISRSDLDGLPEGFKRNFASSGVLVRETPPVWAKRAVFFRDRGLCTICHSDLSKIVRIGETEHYDHIVPLAKGGLNDVTNIQLLCQDCNLNKRDGEADTGDHYEEWYTIDEWLTA
jgi:hypothetical protein